MKVFSYLLLFLSFNWKQPVPVSPSIKHYPKSSFPQVNSYKQFQEPIKKRIDQVEQGLTNDVLLFHGQAVRTKNILDRMQHHKLNGLSIAVINNGTLEWAKAYGVADASLPDPVTSETLFQTASVGKVITTLAALHLVKEGKISLDEDVNQKLTSWKVPENEFTRKEKVTLRRLLSHSAGFTDDYGFGGYNPGEALPTVTQILNLQSPANNKKIMVVSDVPGSSMRYSGGGYVVIQQLIEDLTGQTFQAYVEKEIFQKLGLQHSTYNHYPDIHLRKPVSRGHYPNGKIEAWKKYNVFPEAAAAGFWSTPSDLAKILIQLQKEKQGTSELILNQELVTAMLTPQFESNPRGLGVILMGAHQAEGFGHAGNNPGYNSLLYATSSTGQGAVVMVNSDEGISLAQEVMCSIANVYNWPFMRTYLVKELLQEQRKQYLGSYQSKDGLKVKVGENKNGLFAKFSNPNASVILYPIAQHQFISKEDPHHLRQTFVFDETQKVTALILEKYSGTRMVLKKT